MTGYFAETDNSKMIKLYKTNVIVLINYTNLTLCISNKGAFTNDAIILGRGGLENMTQDDGGRGKSG